jgi:phosphatidate cytidylyltransferase
MLLQRVLTALVLIPVAVYGVFFLPVQYFPWFVGVIVALAAWEWANLAGIKDQPRRVLYALLVSGAMYGSMHLPVLPVVGLAVLFWLAAFYLVLTFPETKDQWQPQWRRFFAGFIVLVPAFRGLVELKGMGVGAMSGNFLILYLFLLIWGADIGAYFSGRTFGKRKLAPKVSPGKSWEGVYGGWFVTLLLVIGLGYYHGGASAPWSPEQWFKVGFLSFVVVLISVVGDLFESMLKRHRGIKDSSNLLPGHGGFMDRIDSLCAAVPFYAAGMAILDLM